MKRMCSAGAARLVTAMGAAVLISILNAPTWASQAQEERPQDLQEGAQRRNEERSAQKERHVGEFVRGEDGRFLMTMEGRKEHSHQLSPEAEITIDGKRAKLEDLRRGDVIRVTTEGDAVVAIEARRRSTSPREHAVDQSEQRRRGGDAEGDDRAWLGVSLQETPGGGVLIGDVFPDGPADHAGLRPGDYIMAIEGKDVTSVRESAEAIAALMPGREVELTIFRDGEQRRGMAKLGSRGEARARIEDQEGETESTEMPAPACEECVQKLAEQHHRLEQQIRELAMQVQTLRSELAQARAGSRPDDRSGRSTRRQGANAPNGVSPQPDNPKM